MINLKPVLDNSFSCPICKAIQPTVHGIRFESTYFFADCLCTNCSYAFYQVLPVSHTINHVLSIGKYDGKIYTSPDTPKWLSSSLFLSHKECSKETVHIERILMEQRDNVVLLNTLDPIYGHVLLKLYNSINHLKNKKQGLILIIPRSFVWLVPAGCAEIWVVDLPLWKLKYGYESIHQFISNELQRFKTVVLSDAFSHPIISNDGIKLLTKTSSFQIDEKAHTFLITFVLREDRWWFGSKVDYWFYRVSRKLGVLKWTSSVLSWRQINLVKETIWAIKKELPNVQFKVVGIGKTGNILDYAHDERQLVPNPETEKNWCATYAQSQIVIGIHGSNMLLPTALAGGCIEILPVDRLGNIVQDITVRYPSRLQLFLCRFTDQYSSPSDVARIAISMITDLPLFQRNMFENIYKE